MQNEIGTQTDPFHESPAESPTTQDAAASGEESFGDMLAQFEHTHARTGESAANRMEGTVVSKDAEFVYLDIGFKTEGVLPLTAFDDNAAAVAPGDRFPVSVKGRNIERYYELSRHKVIQPTDWSSLEAAFEQRSVVVGTVTAVVKGGLTVDIGVRAFMPASRSGVRDTTEMEKLVGQEIACRITKLDATEEDVVVDRRGILEEQARSIEQDRFAELKEGDIVSGKVRSLTSYGAFVDLGGIDGLLHIGDIAWSRVNSAEDVLSAGQELRLKILKVDSESRRISLGLKQLEPEPWITADDRYKVGQRIAGSIMRLTDFGAFVELEPGIEGLIHVSEMSWVKKIRCPSDILKPGDTVEAVVLSVAAAERRISLGLKQALGDPWAEVGQKFPAGSAIEGPVTRLMKFGAFVQLTEGVEGLVHVSEIAVDRHIHHPQDVLRVGQIVKAQVLGVDVEKRQVRLSMKQLVPTSLGEYLEEHGVGDIVSGRVVERSPEVATIELGEGIRATCKAVAASVSAEAQKPSSGPDLSMLTSMLNARWKGGAPAVVSQPEPLQVGQIRSFRLTMIDREALTVEVAPA